MAEPIIDEKWHKDKNFPMRRFLVAGVMLLIVIIAFVLSFFKGCTALGEVAQKNIYSPAEDDKGFVYKSNLLLKDLLADTVPGVKATCLDSLNLKYRALIFDLPYASDDASCIEGADLRLVGIKNDRIPDEWKEFYYNSRLPQLLQQQNEQKSETFFKIQMVSNGDGMTNHMEIKKISLIPAMFKVALAKDPWKGTIYANENCLFNDSNSVYLTYGNTVLPIHRNTATVMSNPLPLYTKEDGLVLHRGAPSFDYYSYYRQTYSVNRSVSLSPTNDVHALNICCTGNNLIISSAYDFNYGKRKEHAGNNVIIPITDGEKLVFYDNNRKVAELTVNTHNPAINLSSLIRTNMGTSRYTVARSQTDLFTQQLLRGLSRNLSNRDRVDNVNITIDPLLSKEFEDELITYLHHIEKTLSYPKKQKDVEYDISLTIMDMATGNVIAAPFYLSRFEKDLKSEALQLITKNVSLRRRFLGSTFKPMMALAAVQSNPALLNINTTGWYNAECDKTNKNEVANFLGRRVITWGKESAWHWNGTDFTNFLAHSDDVYPVALAALAMSEQRGNYMTLSVSADNIFREGPQRMLEVQEGKWHNDRPFAHWLSMLYDANYNENESSDLHLFDGLFPENADDEDADERNFGLEEVSPDITNLHTERFYMRSAFRDEIVPFVLGQGNNEWNSIKIAEAWSRMIGRYDVRAHFIRGNNERHIIGNDSTTNYPSVNGNRTTQNVRATWNSFLDKFEDAQRPGKAGSTLSPMYNAINALNAETHADLVLFSKTGTPDAYVRNEFPLLSARKRFMDMGLYTFTLVKRNQLQRIKQGNPGKGIVCVMRITRHYTCRDCTVSTQCKACKESKGLQSTEARNFFSANPARLRKLYDMTRNYY